MQVLAALAVALAIALGTAPRVMAQGSACSALAAVETWSGSLSFAYGHTATKDEWSIHVDHTANVAFELVPFSSGPGGVSWQGPVSGLAAVNDVWTINEIPPFVATARGSGSPLLSLYGEAVSRVALNLDTVTCEYNFGFTPVIEIGDPATPQEVGTVRSGARPVAPGAGVLGGTAYFPAHSVVWGTENPGEAYLPFVFGLPMFAYGIATEENAGAANVIWSFQPGAGEELDLIVEFEPAGVYETWLPEGGVDEETPGNHLDVKATLTTLSGAPPRQRAEAIVFELTSVSREPGVCLNGPANAATGSPPPDLRFLPEQNPDLVVLGADGLTARTVGLEPEITDASARLSAFDWGAYAILKVTATLPDGRTLVGHLAGDRAGTAILLPKRAAGSLVADAWKAAYGAGLGDLDDSDAQPEGDGHAGDGLTLYEEYRGFHVGLDEGGAPRHLRTDPRRKDFFVLDLIGEKQGIALFAHLTGLEVHHRLERAQMRGDRVINFLRSAGAPHVVDQHAVVLVQGSLKRGWGCATGGPGLPRDVSPLIIERTLSPADVVSVKRDGKTFLANLHRVVVAHELLHATNVYHHGNGDERERWPVVESGGVRDYTWGTVPIVVRDERGRRLGPDPGETEADVWLGEWSAQHSGDELCVMRYAVADAYRKQGAPSEYYWVKGDERRGEELCSTSEGTGVNASGRRPQPRYGWASRGACRRRVCVNDAMDHPAAGQPCPTETR